MYTTPEPKPSKSQAEAITMLTGAPMPVVRVATDAISKSVIAVIRDVSLIVEAVVRRLNFFTSLPLFSVSFRKNLSASSIFLRR